jgi:hypothetical protein
MCSIPASDLLELHWSTVPEYIVDLEGYKETVDLLWLRKRRG